MGKAGYRSMEKQMGDKTESTIGFNDILALMGHRTWDKQPQIREELGKCNICRYQSFWNYVDF